MHEAKQAALETMKRIAAGERLLIVFRWWVPIQPHALEWEAGGDAPPYPAIRYAGERGWLEPEDIAEDKQLIKLTDAGRQQINAAFTDAGTGI